MSVSHYKYILNVLLISIIVVTLCHGANLHKKANDNSILDDDCDDFDECEEREWKLSDGAIAAIVIGVLIIFFGIPILLCFCCAWCCFRGRRKPKFTQVVAAPVQHYATSAVIHASSNPNANVVTQTPYPTAPYPAQQQGVYYNTDANSHIYEQPPPYNAVTASHHNLPHTQQQHIGWIKS